MANWRFPIIAVTLGNAGNMEFSIIIRRLASFVARVFSDFLHFVRVRFYVDYTEVYHLGVVAV